MSNGPPRTPEQEAVIALEADWPGWQIWTVPRAVGGTIWCARRHDDERRVLNADSAADLAARLREQAGR
jgi:hypothetical protein